MTHPALEFLWLLDPSPDARFNIETYTDAKVKSSPDPLQRRYADQSHEDVKALIPQLKRLNLQGAAIYIAVNEFSGHRSTKNLKRVRGIHADLDNVTMEQMDAIRKILPPTIAVQSSTETKQHWYWLIAKGETLHADTARAINKALTNYGADKAAIDVARLLRLPGFVHMKSYNKEIQNAG